MLITGDDEMFRNIGGFVRVVIMIVQNFQVGQRQLGIPRSRHWHRRFRTRDCSKNTMSLMTESDYYNPVNCVNELKQILLSDSAKISQDTQIQLDVIQ